jgi:RNA ligase (TIGR02306 family)
MPRKLASIQRVEALLPIPNADKIELARVEGWQTVVKKGDFKVGDLGVFLEIDAVPPETPAFQFLWQSSKDTERTPRPSNFRLRTKKLRGALSQGLLMPLDAVFGGPNIRLSETVNDDGSVTSTYGRADELGEGFEVTDLIGVTKYEPPPPRTPGSRNHARRVSDFPTHLVPKTDEERIQSRKRVLLELAGKPWIATLKCDGMSATYVFDRLERNAVVACSRNYMVAIEDDNAWGRLALKYELPTKLALPQFQHLAIQGEVVGPSAQGNPLYLLEDELRVFNMFDTVQRKYLTYKEMAKHCEQLGLPMVPVLYEGDSFYPELAGLDLSTDELRTENGPKLTKVLEDLLAKAEGKYEGTKNEREGLVIRPRDEEMYSDALRGRLSFKVISNNFLLNEKDPPS